MERSVRRQPDGEVMKKNILEAAEQLVGEKGLAGLSIRTLAGRIGYSPAIIYHYYKDREDLVRHLLEQGFRRIGEAVARAAEEPSAIKRLPALMDAYIRAALQYPYLYLAAHTSRDAGSRQFTAVLDPAAAEKPAMRILISTLREMDRDSRSPEEILRIAQLMVAAAVGLTIRLIQEPDIPEEHREQLMEDFCRSLPLWEKGTEVLKWKG